MTKGFVRAIFIMASYFGFAQHHRYARRKAPQQKKNTVTFNLQYTYGVLQPGFIYTFR